MKGNFWHPHCGLLVALRGAIPVLVFWSVWVAMSSPRGTKIRNRCFSLIIHVPVNSECYQSRFQLSNVHIIPFQLVRSGEIRVRDGFWGDPCAVLRGVGALFNGR